MCELFGGQAWQEEEGGRGPESDSGATVEVSVAGEEGQQASLYGEGEC